MRREIVKVCLMSAGAPLPPTVVTALLRQLRMGQVTQYSRDSS